MPQSPLQSPLDYQARPPFSTARKHSVWLLVISAAISLLAAMNFLGCDLVLTIVPPSGGRRAGFFWEYSLFSMQAWRDSPEGCVIGLAIGLACAVVLLLVAWGISGRRRWPAAMGLLLVGPSGVLGLLVVGILLWQIIAVFSGRGDGDVLRIHGQVVALGLALATVFPLATIKLVKVLREPMQ